MSELLPSEGKQSFRSVRRLIKYDEYVSLFLSSQIFRSLSSVASFSLVSHFSLSVSLPLSICIYLDVSVCLIHK